MIWSETVIEPTSHEEVELIRPLETTKCDKDTDYHVEIVPTDKGELLLDFVRRHLFTK